AAGADGGWGRWQPGLERQFHLRMMRCMEFV
ncbi:MAG: hypothetical protein ACI814_002153, partial [Mariniblastus sp.]